MNIQRCQPLEARRVFNLRPKIHIGIGSVVFAALLAILIFLINPGIAVLVAGIIAFAVYYYLESRLLVITCPYCRKDINTNTPWQCGFKGCHNLNVDEFPFVHECGDRDCHYIPKAYICHHCEKPIYLTTDQQQMHAARRLESLEHPVKVVIKDLAQDKASRQKDEIGDLEHELGVTTLKKKIEIVKNMPADAPVVKTDAQIMAERVRRGIENGKTLLELEVELLADARKQYANDPDMLFEMEKVIREVIFNEKDRMRY